MDRFHPNLNRCTLEGSRWSALLSSARQMTWIWWLRSATSATMTLLHAQLVPWLSWPRNEDRPRGSRGRLCDVFAIFGYRVVCQYFRAASMNFTHAAWEHPRTGHRRVKRKGSGKRVRPNLSEPFADTAWPGLCNWIGFVMSISSENVGLGFCGTLLFVGVGMCRAISLPESDRLWTDDVIWIDMTLVCLKIVYP